MKLFPAPLAIRLSTNPQRQTARVTPRLNTLCWVTAGLLVAASPGTQADELITLSNGMTCWRNASGVTYGCSGGVNTGDGGFNDTRTGERYERINPHQAIDTRTGQTLELPSGNRSRNSRDQDEW